MNILEELYMQYWVTAGGLVKFYRDNHISNAERDARFPELSADLEQLVLKNSPIAIGVKILELIDDGKHSEAITLCGDIRQWHTVYRFWRGDSTKDSILLLVMMTLFELGKSERMCYKPGYLFSCNGDFFVRIKTEYFVNGDGRRISNPQEETLYNARLHGDLEVKIDGFSASIQRICLPYSFLDRLANAVKKRGVDVCFLHDPDDGLPW